MTVLTILLLVLGGCGQEIETTHDSLEVVQERTAEDALVTAAQPVLGEEGADVEEMVVAESEGETTAESDEEAVAAVEESEASPQSVDVAIRNYAFDEKTITIKAGDTVVWTNYDSAPHTVTATDESFDSGKMSKGSVWSTTFETPGTYEYYCAYHPNMKATVVVE